jgi:hypothetical protein
MELGEKKMQALLLTPEIETSIDSLVEFASRPENRWKVGVSDWTPGDRKDFVRILPVAYKLVFTLTELPNGEVYRHMSLSFGKKEKWPNEIATFTLATMCGFTGGRVQGEATMWPGEDWGLNMNREDGCIEFSQKIPADQVPT